MTECGWNLAFALTCGGSLLVRVCWWRLVGLGGGSLLVVGVIGVDVVMILWSRLLMDSVEDSGCVKCEVVARNGGTKNTG